MNLSLLLPPLFGINLWDHGTYELLYKIFHKDFIVNKTKYPGGKLSFQNKKRQRKNLNFGTSLAAKIKIIGAVT